MHASHMGKNHFVPWNKKLVKGKIDEDKKCLAKLYIKVQRHTSSAEIQTAAFWGEKRAEMKKRFKEDTQNTTVGKRNTATVLWHWCCSVCFGFCPQGSPKAQRMCMWRCYGFFAKISLISLPSLHHTKHTTSSTRMVNRSVCCTKTQSFKVQGQLDVLV